MSWENLYSWSQILVVFFAGVALVSGLIVNKRQSRHLLELETNLSKQREKTALAEKATLELERFIKEPRTIDRKHGDDILDWGQKGSVKIWYNMIGDEPRNLARQLAEILYSHGWQILSVEPAIVPAGRPGIVIRGHGDSKVNFVGIDWTGAPEPVKTLHRLLVEAVTGNPIVETRIGPDEPRDNLGVTIAGKY